MFGSCIIRKTKRGEIDMDLSMFDTEVAEDAVFKIQDYVSAEGKSVRELIDDVNNVSYFVGQAALQKRMMMPNGEQAIQSFPIEFPIDAKNVSEAYEKFDEAVNFFVEEQKKESEKRIVAAPAGTLDALDKATSNIIAMP